MTDTAPDPDVDPEATARHLATTPHGELDEDAVAALDEVVAAARRAADDGADERAADLLLAFWDAYVAAGLADAKHSRAADSDASTPTERLSRGFAGELVGVDLYQALARLRAVRTGDDTGSLAGWTRRVATLTTAFRDHLRGHL